MANKSKEKTKREMVVDWWMNCLEKERAYETNQLFHPDDISKSFQASDHCYNKTNIADIRNGFPYHGHKLLFLHIDHGSYIYKGPDAAVTEKVIWTDENRDETIIGEWVNGVYREITPYNKLKTTNTKPVVNKTDNIKKKRRKKTLPEKPHENKQSLQNRTTKNNPQAYTEQIHKYLDEIITDLLINFLNNSLPKISNGWWEKTVFANLTDQQKSNVKRKNINSLDELDIAALLRVFDLNWNELSQQHSLLYEDRNILKEMQAVRNRWSHKPKTGYNLDDIYRDYDTMERFLKLLGGSQEIVDEFQIIKLRIREEMK